MKTKAIFENCYGEEMTLIWDTIEGTITCHHNDAHEKGKYVELSNLSTTMWQEEEVMFINAYIDICQKYAKEPCHYKIKPYLKKTCVAMLMQELEDGKSSEEIVRKTLGNKLLKEIRTGRLLLKLGQVYVDRRKAILLFPISDYRKIMNIVEFPTGLILIFWMSATKTGSCTPNSFKSWVYNSEAELEEESKVLKSFDL